jgi:hypothetical protein
VETQAPVMIFEVLGSLGGVVAFSGAVWVIVRAIARNVQATEENTKATQGLSAEMREMRTVVNGHGERIASLEGWRSGKDTG